MLTAVVAHGEQGVADAISAALAADRTDLLDLARQVAQPALSQALVLGTADLARVPLLVVIRGG